MNRRIGIGLGLSLFLLVLGWGSPAAAQGMPQVVGNSATLTLDVLPLQAEVRLNGVPIGTAHDLVARPVVVMPGQHVLTMSAPGYLAASVSVVGAEDWTTRVF